MFVLQVFALNIVLSQSEVNPSNSDIIRLDHDHGFVRQRTRTDPAVVRYARLSPTKDTEKYHQSILQLFLPHHTNSDLKPPPFESFEDYYKLGTICYNENVISVKSIVDENRSLFEKESEKIDEAKEIIENFGTELEDFWAQICPESEENRLECLNLIRTQNEVGIDEHNAEIIPDFTTNAEIVAVLEKSVVNVKKRCAKSSEIPKQLSSKHLLSSSTMVHIQSLRRKSRSILCVCDRWSWYWQKPSD